MMLEVKEVTKKFGGLVALDSVSLDVEENALLGIIGPNGSGKTTLFNSITRIIPPDKGEILYKGKSCNGLKPHDICKLGIGRMFQIPAIFKKITVLENVMVPLIAKKLKEEDKINEAWEMLKVVGLQKLAYNLGGELSIGQQRLLEFARVNMLRPELLLLDEPFVGVAPGMKNEMIEVIKKLHKEGKTIISISHDIPSIMMLCEWIIVMNLGKIICVGKPEDIRRDKMVVEAYLGV